MALIVNRQYKGLPIEKSYNRIVSFYGDKHSITVVVGCSADKDLAPIFISEYTVKFNLEATDNVIKEAYSKLKSLDDFLGAVDA